MKVRELLAALAGVDPEAEVLIDYETVLGAVERAGVVPARYCPWRPLERARWEHDGDIEGGEPRAAFALQLNERDG